FFFQAEDGIRDFHVTGVQTCALPICYASFFIDAVDTVRRGDSMPSRSALALNRSSSCLRASKPPCERVAYSVTTWSPALWSRREIGRASCRERGEIAVVDASLTNTKV